MYLCWSFDHRCLAFHLISWWQRLAPGSSLVLLGLALQFCIIHGMRSPIHPLGLLLFAAVVCRVAFVLAWCMIWRDPATVIHMVHCTGTAPAVLWSRLMLHGVLRLLLFAVCS